MSLPRPVIRLFGRRCSSETVGAAGSTGILFCTHCHTVVPDRHAAEEHHHDARVPDGRQAAVVSDDPFAAGWDAGYRRALLDVRAELDRITVRQGRAQAEVLLARLLAQHRTDQAGVS